MNVSRSTRFRKAIASALTLSLLLSGSFAAAEGDPNSPLAEQPATTEPAPAATTAAENMKMMPSGTVCTGKHGVGIRCDTDKPVAALKDETFTEADLQPPPGDQYENAVACTGDLKASFAMGFNQGVGGQFGFQWRDTHQDAKDNERPACQGMNKGPETTCCERGFLKGKAVLLKNMSKLLSKREEDPSNGSCLEAFNQGQRRGQDRCQEALNMQAGKQCTGNVAGYKGQYLGCYQTGFVANFSHCDCAKANEMRTKIAVQSPDYASANTAYKESKETGSEWPTYTATQAR